MNQTKDPITVSQLTSLIKSSLENDPRFLSIYMHGEISNFKVYPSGHAYFSLKDKDAVISSMMWQTYVRGLDFAPKDGDEVVVHGKLSVYPPRGSYSIVVDHMERYGEGEALKKLRLLAEKLSKEGLFDPSRKRPIKAYPTHVGVIAGRGSAGLRDIEVNLLRRYPIVQLHIFPSLVQGADAPKALLEAFQLAQSCPLDTLIIARGGGSSEDLGAFNDETLVRALATSKCPVIAAVGHEVDVTLVDLVADLRVSTPTAAAVAATPNKEDIYQFLDDASLRSGEALKKRISMLKDRLNMLSQRSFFLHPESIYQEKQKELQEKQSRITLSYKHLIDRKAALLQNLSDRLTSVNPNNVLKRGYSIVEGSDGRVLTSIANIQINDTLKVKLQDGSLTVHTLSKEEN